uniref:RBR-type E3 ubiquitin transferase n=1 Tax=Romanomermis culicivorax TaxID=13658 RepID=A0A915ISJ9_ROMCU
MRDVVTCPRNSCGSFVVMDENIRNMALCSECNFAFCTLCRKVYHGLARCTFTNTEIQCILNEYKTGDEKVRTAIEEKYGKVTIERLVEESESSQWVTDNCRPCPICSSPIQKLDGCNKMSCMKCGSYFCWLCMKTLNKDTPYKHFNDPESQCFNLLFRGVRTMDDGDFDDEDDL